MQFKTLIPILCLSCATVYGEPGTRPASTTPPDLQVELQRSKPDFVVYVPGSADGSTGDTGNEHFLVFDGPDGSLMALWTQSTAEGAGNHRIMFSRSNDEGSTWAKPRRLAGSPRKG
ncbi:MAG: exo-alpha-sialidase, partial [Phycisphaerae bacterium]|nr:exo-alpha-sialidase [Phycisphaerae bacterium]